MSRDELIAIGFKPIPHFTVTDTLTYDLGRNRYLAFRNVGTPNEVLFIGQVNEESSNDITDLICLRNYDYDGYTTIEEVKDLLKFLKQDTNGN